MNRKQVLSVGMSSVLVALACSSDPKVDLGDGPLGQRGERLSDYAAEWVGYAEAYIFADDTDVVSLTLDENGEGFLKFGGSAPLAPLDLQEPESSSYYGLVGFAYPVSASVYEGRLQLTVLRAEPYRAWCEGQAPIEHFDSNGNEGGGTYYQCSPVGGRAPQGDGTCLYTKKWDVGEVTPDVWNCNALEVCDMYCACEADGCTLSDPTQIILDAAFEGEDELVGTWRTQEGTELSPGVTIRLAKAE